MLANLPPTPCLMLDLDALRRNIDRMAVFARSRGLRLRPHAKTHKCRAIAGLQAEAGAVGICCATLHEAEQMTGAAPSILVTSPLAGAPSAERVARLARAGVDLSIVADHPAFPAMLDAALTDDQRVTVIVDADPGMGRSGVAGPAEAVALVRAIAGCSRLIYGGIQYYCGGEQHIASLVDRREAMASRNARLSAFIDALVSAGLAPPVVTGGGTGTHGIDADAGLLTEIQPGSYIFMDQDYGACEIDGAGPFELALTLHATVVSANQPGWVTVDAGIKAFATDSGTPMVVAGADPACGYRFAGDEFGRLVLPEGVAPPDIGARVAFAVSHCDPTVNLHQLYHLQGAGRGAGRWLVDARGYGGAECVPLLRAAPGDLL